jgi:predicted MFS family arabinose efflux permease
MVFWVTAISALGNLACALAPTLPLLVVARFASGATVGAIVPLAMAWIGDAVPYEKRQPVLARFLIGTMLGGAITSMLSGTLGERYGWQAIFYVMAALYVVAAFFLFLEMRSNPATHSKPGAREPLFRAFSRMLGLVRGPWVRVVLFTVFVEGALSYGGLAFAAYHGHHALGLSVGASGVLVASAAVGGLLYAAVAGRLVRGLGERGLVIGGGVLLAIGLPGFAAAPNAYWAALCLVAQGMGVYMMHNTLQVHATQMAPDARGAAVALFAFCLFSGQSLGVWLASLMVDARGTLPVFLAAGAGLVLLAYFFQRQLHSHRLR